VIVEIEAELAYNDATQSYSFTRFTIDGKSVTEGPTFSMRDCAGSVDQATGLVSISWSSMHSNVLAGAALCLGGREGDMINGDWLANGAAHPAGTWFLRGAEGMICCCDGEAADGEPCETHGTFVLYHQEVLACNRVITSALPPHPFFEQAHRQRERAIIGIVQADFALFTVALLPILLGYAAEPCPGRMPPPFQWKTTRGSTIAPTTVIAAREAVAVPANAQAAMVARAPSNTENIPSAAAAGAIATFQDTAVAALTATASPYVLTGYDSAFILRM
jgi:hypothetical protein